jgi:UDP-GlcNAc:undecaprenyl-phosphate GlcNAc-1-phosphate transferase
VYSVLYGIVAATTAVLLAAALCALLRGPGLRAGVVVVGRRGRRVPVVGGLAVVGTVGAVIGAGEWSGAARLGGEVTRVLLAAAAVAATGFAEDLWPARPRPGGRWPRVARRTLRFGVPAAAAALVVPYDVLGVPGGLLAAGWIVLVAHGFVALDHADGVMGTAGVVMAFGLGVCAVADVRDGLAALLCVLAAALTGFLMHNAAPARVTAGRGGALFTGFVPAAVAVLVLAGRGPGVGGSVLAALGAVPVMSVRLRWARGLRGTGVTPRGVAVVVAVLSAAAAVPAVLVFLEWAPPLAAWCAAAAVAGAVVACGLVRRRVRRPAAGAGPGTRGGPAGAEECATFTRVPAPLRGRAGGPGRGVGAVGGGPGATGSRPVARTPEG